MPPKADVEILTLSSDDEEASPIASTSRVPSATKQSPSKSGSSTKSSQNSGKNPFSGAMKRQVSSSDSPKKDEAMGAGGGKRRKTGTAEEKQSSGVDAFTSSAAASASASTLSSARTPSLSSDRLQFFVTRPSSAKLVNDDHLRQPLKHLLNTNDPGTTLSALITGFELDWKSVKEAAFGAKGNAKSRISVACDKIAFPGKLTVKDLEKAAPGVVVKLVEPFQKIGNHAKVVIVRFLFFVSFDPSKLTCARSQLEREPPTGPAYLTVVIWSGNLNGPHSLTLENAGVVFTLPVLSSPSSSPSANPTHTFFSRDLYAFLASQKLQQGAKSRAFLDVFARYDFSATEDCRLVWSLGGKHDLSALGPGGLGALAQGVKALRGVKGGDFSVEWLVRRYPSYLAVSLRSLRVYCREPPSATSTLLFSKPSSPPFKVSSRNTAFEISTSSLRLTSRRSRLSVLLTVTSRRCVSLFPPF
jgi:hypothetical protein